MSVRNLSVVVVAVLVADFDVSPDNSSTSADFLVRALLDGGVEMRLALTPRKARGLEASGVDERCDAMRASTAAGNRRLADVRMLDAVLRTAPVGGRERTCLAKIYSSCELTSFSVS